MVIINENLVNIIFKYANTEELMYLLNVDFDTLYQLHMDHESLMKKIEDRVHELGQEKVVEVIIRFNQKSYLSK